MRDFLEWVGVAFSRFCEGNSKMALLPVAFFDINFADLKASIFIKNLCQFLYMIGIYSQK